ncbi:MAG TPA: SpoIIE family protein phosphatase [Patescibacteria group bacterium]|nr:SpoIIE family protein phosphatase [Patescibacteria group bacterium]
MKPLHGRVLVVDDDGAMLRTVERILAPVHAVRGFTSGEEAIRVFRDQPFDVAIIDIRMPGMDGFELTRAIKETRPATEVILVTGSISDLDEKLIRSVKERAGFFITKPFSRSVLTSLVERCLEIQALERERDELIQRLTEDLERARRFQMALLPRDLPRDFGPIRVAAGYLSCQEVGGDFYDVVPLRDDRLLLVFADVAGHGVAAALVTGMIKTALARSIQDGPDLAATATAVTDCLAPLGAHRVVTLFLAVVDARRRSLEYLNAGHPPPLIWGGPGGSAGPVELEATTPLLSFGLGLSKAPVRRQSFGPGQRLAVYSDGIYEARDPSGAEWGREPLVEAIQATKGPIEEVARLILERSRTHAGGRPAQDDLTLLLAEFARG